jgi:hypothetical protein
MRLQRRGTQGFGEVECQGRTIAFSNRQLAFQLAGALGRIAAGVWSDRVASRLRPMRQLAVVSAALMLLIAAGAATGTWLVVLGFALVALCPLLAILTTPVRAERRSAGERVADADVLAAQLAHE